MYYNCNLSEDGTITLLFLNFPEHLRSTCEWNDCKEWLLPSGAIIRSESYPELGVTDGEIVIYVPGERKDKDSYVASFSPENPQEFFNKVIDALNYFFSTYV